MSERLDDRVVAAVGVIVKIDGKREPCMTRNVSRGGMFVLTKMDLAPGAEVQLEIVHEGKRLIGNAKVTTKTAQGVGLAFSSTDPEFGAGVDGLLRSLLKRPNEDLGAGEVEVSGRMAWSHLPDGRAWNWWRKRKMVANLVSLSLDGAAMVASRRPEPAELVLIYLTDSRDESGEPVFCRAEVVRHTDHGFAVKFLSPSLEFRRAVSRLRQGGGT